MNHGHLPSSSTCLLAIACLVLVGCGPRVTTDWRTDVAFTDYRTWTWHPEGPQRGTEINDLMADRIHAAITETMPAAGMPAVTDTASADLLVRWRARIERKQNVSTTSFGVGSHAPAAYRGPWYHGYGANDLHTFVYEWNEAVLTIDLRAATDDRLLWQGTTVWNHDEDDTPEERRGKIRRAVTRILDAYPPATD